MIANCLTCHEPYKTNPNASPQEYPYCDLCNIKEVRNLKTLFISVDPTSKSYKNRPGKRHGQKTRINLDAIKERKRLKGVAARGVYENSLGALNGLSLGF